MKRNVSPSVPQSPQKSIGCLGGLLRMFWMALGILALFFCAMFAARKQSRALDVLYAVIVVAMLAARYIDIAHFKGQTTDGEPATIAHWRRYAVLLVIFAPAWWALARFATAHGWM